MVNFVVNAAFASALIAAPLPAAPLPATPLPSDQEENKTPFVPNKLRGISFDGKDAKRSDHVLFRESEATPQVDDVIDIPQENALHNTIQFADIVNSSSDFDPSAELGHLENPVLPAAAPAHDDGNAIDDIPVSDIGEKIPPTYDHTEALWYLENTSDDASGFGFSEIAMYLNDNVSPATSWEDFGLQVENYNNDPAIARDLGEERYNYNDCGGNYPVIEAIGISLLNLVRKCFPDPYGCPPQYNAPLRCWETSRVTNMDYTFFASDYFNEDISFWNTDNVTSMEGMFKYAYEFNQPIGAWNVAKVKNMEGMFYYAPAFNQDINYWDVSSVTSMKSMFEDADSFNQPIGAWNVAKVTDMAAMFTYAKNFNQDMSYWDVSSVTTMYSMIQGTDSFNQPIGAWNVAKVTDMSAMFNSARKFNQDISYWDVSFVTDMNYMFQLADSFNQNIGVWDVANVERMNRMFRRASDFNQPIGVWDVANVKDMNDMFRNATTFNQCLSSWGQKVPDDVTTNSMFLYTDCSGPETPQPDTTKWCQTVKDGCIEDQSDKFTIDVDGTLKTKDCEWLASKKAKKRKEYCKVKVEINGIEKKLKKICKKTCGEFEKEQVEKSDKSDKGSKAEKSFKGSKAEKSGKADKSGKSE